MFTVSPVGGNNEVLDRRREPGGPGRCGSKELPHPGARDPRWGNRVVTSGGQERKRPALGTQRLTARRMPG
jgi:hypothetical protein